MRRLKTIKGVPDRGPNTGQMTAIARNCFLTTRQRKKFYRAVRKFKGGNWKYGICHQNSQEFYIASGLHREMKYREGYVCYGKGDGTYKASQHAWLEWDGKILDLTLGLKIPQYDTSDGRNYLDYYPFWTPETLGEFGRAMHDRIQVRGVFGLITDIFWDKDTGPKYRKEREAFESVRGVIHRVADEVSGDKTGLAA